MKLICKMLGGSHAYGLNTPDSDEDFRGVFLNEDLGQIIGLDRFEHQDLKANGKDEFYFEFRHFLNLLRKTNTQVLELLFNENWIDEPTKEYKLLQQNRVQLIDSQRMYKSLKGYIHGERRLANGERTGLLGDKRKEALDKYGFSPKNFVQLLRLCWAGCVFYSKGVFPVHVPSFEPAFADYLLQIKRFPEKFTKEDLNKAVDTLETSLDKEFEATKINYKFNEVFANNICLDVYRQFLKHPLAQ